MNKMISEPEFKEKKNNLARVFGVVKMVKRRWEVFCLHMKNSGTTTINWTKKKLFKKQEKKNTRRCLRFKSFSDILYFFVFYVTHVKINPILFNIKWKDGYRPAMMQQIHRVLLPDVQIDSFRSTGDRVLN